VGDLTVNRFLPNRYVRTVGPFFFLDHLLPTELKPKRSELPDGFHAHPHRGIATFTYLFSGELEHFDSRGNHGIVSDGGAQWMKAGNGIVHDENPSRQFQEKGGLLHGLQFWINLPARNKAESPEYLAVQEADFPYIDLPENAGRLKVVIGEYKGRHLRLNPESSFILSVDPEFESAAFVPAAELTVNGELHGKGELVIFEITGGDIKIVNNGNTVADVILFGGEAYREPIVAEGPFVMNSETEIAEAYLDARKGRYGKISYSPAE
jgi:redox-sensitive bicupin YhaK (pirin superfamily)